MYRLRAVVTSSVTRPRHLTTGCTSLSSQAIGYAKRLGDEIPFVFSDSGGSISFRNTFAYDKSTDSWAWLMDNIQNGKPVPFGRVKLTRK